VRARFWAKVVVRGGLTVAVGALAVGGWWAVTNGPLASSPTHAGAGSSTPLVARTAAATGAANSKVLSVVSVSPKPLPATTAVAATSTATTSKGISPRARIKVTFNEALAPDSLPPVLQPALAGSWVITSPNVFTFEPSAPMLPESDILLTLASGVSGPHARNGAELDAPYTASWQVRSGSVLRIQELLAQWGYLPLNWTSTTTISNVGDGGRRAAFYSPPKGTFTWRYPNIPATLAAVWKPGVANHMTMGAIVAFERQHGLPAYTSIRPILWSTLLTAEGEDTVNPDGYSYIMVFKTLPEHIEVWHDGTIVYTSIANTGIPQDPTTDGTYFIYLRYASTTMSGYNPNGAYYDDHGVRWVNYFNGSEAVHAFIRASYGFPQSLGCVELPPANAAVVWTLVHYGTLVTINAAT
jgi:hypothetical protein